MSVSSYLSPRFPTIRVILVASMPIWMTFTEMSLLLKGYMRDEEDETRWC
jgi:hypothetical protein